MHNTQHSCIRLSTRHIRRCQASMQYSAGCECFLLFAFHRRLRAACVNLIEFNVNLLNVSIAKKRNEPGQATPGPLRTHPHRISSIRNSSMFIAYISFRYHFSSILMENRLFWLTRAVDNVGGHMLNENDNVGGKKYFHNIVRAWICTEWKEKNGISRSNACNEIKALEPNKLNKNHVKTKKKIEMFHRGNCKPYPACIPHHSIRTNCEAIESKMLWNNWIEDSLSWRWK